MFASLESWIATIIVPLIVVSIPLLWKLFRFDRRNTAQHESGQVRADERHDQLMQAIGGIHQRIDDHEAHFEHKPRLTITQPPEEFTA